MTQPDTSLRLVCLLCLATTLPSAAQQFEIGVKAGVPITDSFATSSSFGIDFGEGATSATQRYTIGPTVGLHLPHGLTIEFDALYSRLGFDVDTKSGGVVFADTRTTAASWEFPILGKFAFPLTPAIKPFVDGGISLPTTSGISSTTLTYTPSLPVVESSSTSSPFLANRSWYGAVVGLGAEARIGRLRVSPEIRYTRWPPDRNLDLQLHSNQNQLDFLLGITI
jgi:hypothetical protein